MKWTLFDVEGDGLDATKLHCLSWEDDLGNTGTETGYAGILGLLREPDRGVLVGHNIIRWDIPTLERLLNTDLSSKFLVDTLALAWVLDPDRAKHGLESYGEDFGIEKPYIADWENQSLDDYIHRCQTDVKINVALWKSQLERLSNLYDDPDDLVSYLRYISFKMDCARKQEESGWKLDEERVHTELKALTEERDKKFTELSRIMPDVPVRDIKSPPKRMLKGDGQPSELAKKWFEFLDREGLPRDHGEPVEYISRYEPPNPNSSDQKKDWLFSLGWKPQTFKYVRDTKTGEMRDIPQINLPNGGGICPSVLDLADVDASVAVLAGYGVLSHRISILNGFLRDVSDGRLRAKVAGLTNTLRFKHAEIVNLPKAEKLYATGIRSCLVADEGDELCGADMSSLEDRIKQHYIYEYDPVYVRELNKPDYDAHLDIAGLVYDLSKRKDGISPEHVRIYKSSDKSNKDLYNSIKNKRGIFKNGNYACQYGAMPPRLVLTCDIDLKTAQLLYDAYWKRNWAIKEVAKNQKVKIIKVAGRQEMWLLNPVSGFWYSLRAKKDIFSTLVQGTAAYVFDLWVRELLTERPQLTGQFHDEIILSIKKGFRQQATDLLNQSIQKTNTLLQLNRELDISVQFGDNYGAIH